MKQKRKIIYFGLSGASGRMGQVVKKATNIKNSEFVICKTWPVIKKKSSTSPHADSLDVDQLDGVIDFSAPPLFEQTIRWCLKQQKPFVSGTTALNDTQKKLLKKASQKIPIFYEENMSWGIWQIKKWITNLHRQHNMLIQLEDIHHKDKKDKPSGTALKLLRSFTSPIQKQIKIKSIRKGKEFGTHRISFKTKQEVVVLEHRAIDRILFAKGALRALKWLVLQPKGFYGWDDFYNTQTSQ